MRRFGLVLDFLVLAGVAVVLFLNLRAGLVTPPVRVDWNGSHEITAGEFTQNHDWAYFRYPQGSR